MWLAVYLFTICKHIHSVFCSKLIVLVFDELLWFRLFQKKPRRKKRQNRDSTFFPTLGGPGCLDASDDEAKTRLSASDLKAEVIEKVHEYIKQDSQMSPFSHPGVKVSDVLQ